MNGIDLVPDECSSYDETNIMFHDFVSKLKVTHRWCGDTKQFVSVAAHAKHLKAKLDKEIDLMYTDFGGEA